MNCRYTLYNRVEKPCIIGEISTYSRFGECVSGKANRFTRDGGEGITIAWNTSGKVKSVTGGSSPLDFSYTALGQRQMKAYLADGAKAFDYYIHDATGNIMAIYTLSDNYSRFQLKERHIYGSSRLGIYQRDIGIYPSEETLPLSFTRGLKRYELSNHLGNVISVFSDRKRQGKVGFYTVDHKGHADYYPFGYQMPQRTVKSADYRFGFNGQEKDDEIYGEGNSTTAEYWQYDARLARRWNVDMRPNFSVSSYATFLNNPIVFRDMLGDTVKTAGKIEEQVYNNYKDILNSRVANAQQEIENYKKKLETNSSDFWNTKLDNAEQNLAIYQGILNELSEMEKATTVFMIRINENIITPTAWPMDAEGAITYNLETKQVDINMRLTRNNIFNEIQIMSHELLHGYQFLKRDLDFNPTGLYPGWLYDKVDEINAFKRQNLFYDNYDKQYVNPYKKVETSPAYRDLPSKRQTYDMLNEKMKNNYKESGNILAP